MIILTSDGQLAHRWDGGYIRIDDRTRQEGHFELKVQGCPFPLFTGTEEQCKGVLWEIANAPQDGLYVVPTPEQYVADEATFRRVTTEAIEREDEAHRKAHPEAYTEAEG